MADLRFVPAGDKAFVIEMGDRYIPRNQSLRCITCFLAIEKQGIPGILDMVPTYRSLLINYDPLTLPPSELEKRVRELTQDLDETPPEAFQSGRVAHLRTAATTGLT